MPKKKKGGGGGKSTKVKKAQVDKIVVDKTFGMKNKNKSKKVQRYIAQVKGQVSGKRGGAQAEAAAAAERKRKKMAQKQAEKEMMMLLGDSYTMDKKKAKKKKKEEAKKAELEKQKKQKEMDEIDFALPIVPLSDVFAADSKVVVERIVGVLTKKDNLTQKNKDGTDYITARIDDGTTLNPMLLRLNGWNASNFEFKVNKVIDIRGAVAMVRSKRVEIELTKGSVGECSSVSGRLEEHVLEAKANAEELRAQGGVPIEDLIEQQRANLKVEDLIPVTKERFMEWKAKKKAKKEAEWEEQQSKAKTAKGKAAALSGRALFHVNKDLFKDDEGALDDNDYDVVSSDDEVDEAAKKLDGVSIDKVDDSLFVEGDDDDLDDLDDLDDDEE